MTPLPPAETKRVLARRGAKMEKFLATVLDRQPDTPQRLREAMLYSLQAGGKRIRPVLCMACASLCGMANEDRVLPFAAAIEMIHTYSLIHDDLPSMDNDDMRRGKPSNHRQFDEATAILAGDALLTDAFLLMTETDLPAPAILAALREIAQSAGSAGMAGGQMLDMQYTAKTDVTLEQVAQMQALKTGALLRGACVSGALLAGASSALLEAVKTYGMAIGRAFQITDDILDLTGSEDALGKPVGSDAASGKNTYPSRIGIGASHRIAAAEVEKAKAALPRHVESGFLAGLADYVLARSS